jgi:transposase
MSKPLEVPHDYQCPYRQACPHLEGMSTEAIWHRHELDLQQAQEDRERIDQLVEWLNQSDQEVRRLKLENQQWRAQLKTIHQKQFKANKPAPTPQEAGVAPKKKRGAPVGHPPWQRSAPDHLDRKIAVPPPACCPHCQCADLHPVKETLEHWQEDIVIKPVTHVVCFTHQQAWCPCCERNVIQAAPGELLGSAIGPIAKATAVYLRYGIGLTYRKVQKVFTQLFNLRFVPATALNFDRAATRKGGELYEDLRQKIQASDYLHMDETGWRVDGVNHHLWYAGHERLAFFHIDRHRSTAVAETIVGPKFEGILNTDGYCVYEALWASDKQTCLSHLLRAAKELAEPFPALLLTDLSAQPTEAQRQAKGFSDRVQKLIGEACQLGRRLREKPVQASEARRLKNNYQQRLQKICARALAHPEAEKLRLRLWENRAKLFTFIRYPEVGPTNNQAEQSLRPSVILRKLTFGNRSPAGARHHSVLSSLLITAQRQGRDARTAMLALFTQPASVAKKAFYHNSS